MKFRNWKDAAELVGIAAIVASLIFVGLQMRQSGAIARSQMYGNDLANSLSTYNAIAEHPDIWVRGKRGDELDPANAEVFHQQVLGIADQAYYEVLEGALLGFDSSEIQLDVIDFAGSFMKPPVFGKYGSRRNKGCAGIGDLFCRANKGQIGSNA